MEIKEYVTETAHYCVFDYIYCQLAIQSCFNFNIDVSHIFDQHLHHCQVVYRVVYYKYHKLSLNQCRLWIGQPS